VNLFTILKKEITTESWQQSLDTH